MSAEAGVAASGRCAICQSSLAPDEALAACPSCSTAYHAECWEDNRGCALHGCPMVPPTEPLTDIEMPASVWGVDEKACPSCAKTILAAARRCRYCGAMLAGDRAQTAAEFAAERRTTACVPALRRGAILVFVLGAIPCTAPFALAGGLWWRRARRAELQALSPLHSAVLRAGIGLAAVETSLMLLVGLAALARS